MNICKFGLPPPLFKTNKAPVVVYSEFNGLKRVFSKCVALIINPVVLVKFVR